MGEGVVVFNEVLTPVLVNDAARRILGIGGSLPSIVPLPEVTSLARSALMGTAGREPVEVSRPDGLGVVRLRAAAVEDAGLVLVYLADVTEELRVQAMRRQFVSHASHELKTPVASIEALAEAVSQAAAEDPEAAERFSARMVQEAERLGGLVRDLLDLSRLEDPANISRSVVDLSALVEAEGRTAAEASSRKGINFALDIDPGVQVRGDESQLSLMLRNLIDNALRYTEPGGRVTLGVTTEHGDAVVTVADTGRGIPMRDQARVFERFYRVDEARARSEGGTGLGLAIVKHVVDLHSGRVALSSQLGEGSTFTVHLRAFDEA